MDESESACSMKFDDLKPIRSLGEDSTHKFLGVLESVKQENELTLRNAAGSYLQRLSIVLVKSTVVSVQGSGLKSVRPVTTNLSDVDLSMAFSWSLTAW